MTITLSCKSYHPIIINVMVLGKNTINYQYQDWTRLEDVQDFFLFKLSGKDECN
ncbi:hypothetical protein [Crocosphaera sp. Alani8]|uniref:hypothetical protein n=1 Tax=Crocosphaera sp. Alani8 TaxID=3038952 RepID=UPI00313CC443